MRVGCEVQEEGGLDRNDDFFLNSKNKLGVHSVPHVRIDSRSSTLEIKLTARSTSRCPRDCSGDSAQGSAVCISLAELSPPLFVRFCYEFQVV